LIYYLQLMTKNSHKINMNTFYKNKHLINTYSTKFLGLFIRSSLLWNNHIAQLMSRLSTACYVISSVKSFVTQETLRKFYFFMVIQFWLMIPFCWVIHTIAIISLRWKKNNKRCYGFKKYRDLCRTWLKQWNILPLKSECTFSLLLFVVKNKKI
jgi:hypothetical protein